MGITCKWDNAQKDILLTEFRGAWDWQDYNLAFAEWRRMIDSVDHPLRMIAHIADDRAAAAPGANIFARWRVAIHMEEHKVRQIIIVSDNFVARTYFTISQRLFANYPGMKRFKMVSTLKEARLIAQSLNAIQLA